MNKRKRKEQDPRKSFHFTPISEVKPITVCVYHFCQDTTQYTEFAEVYKILESVEACFIFVLHTPTLHQDCEKIMTIMAEEKCLSCLLSVRKESDIETIAKMIKQRTITIEKLKAMKAERILYKPRILWIKEKESLITKDWVTDEEETHL